MEDHNDGDDNRWVDWRRFILKELERLNDCMETQQRALQNISLDIATLKVKAGIWGGIAGLIPALLTILYFIIKNAK